MDGVLGISSTSIPRWYVASPTVSLDPMFPTQISIAAAGDSYMTWEGNEGGTMTIVRRVFEIPSSSLKLVEGID
jgi:hypothetical protein